MYEITFVDSGKTEVWSESQCQKIFGAKEWKEIKAGNLPHIVAIKVS